MNDYFFFIFGVVCAGIGGELFVRAAVGMGRWMRVSPGIIGATFAAFATSSPELSVSVNAAMAGRPQIALGDALGSNVVNVALILALALLFSGIQTPRDSVKRDFPVALLIPILTAALFLDGELSRLDGLLMLGLFIVWLVAAVITARQQRPAEQETLGKQEKTRTVLAGVIGLALLMVAGNLIVAGARSIALSFGMDEFLIGATIVAVGTSVPELATTLIAKLRGHDDVGLGIILGSNIFNGIFIVAVAALIHPINVAWREIALTLSFGFLVLVSSYPTRQGLIQRWRGFLLLALYAAYLVALFQFQVV